MTTLHPSTPKELAEALASAAAAGQSITLGGHFSKDWMAGPLAPASVRISTAALNRILIYEPGDLTVSVEAGMSYCELSRILAEKRQMIPLDPPFSGEATIGGVLAANTNGPRRRLYGAARDLVIGMQFATLEGKLVQSGGMVVKNVAGLDMAKLMIGSFGTLAAIAVANFKVIPMPPRTRSFVLAFDTLADAAARRNDILKSVLQPAAIDLLNPRAAERIGRQGWLLLLQAGGNAAVIDRYSRELGGAGTVEDEAETELWARVQNFTPHFLAEHGDGAVVRVSCTLMQVPDVVAASSGPVVARAGSGVCYLYFQSIDVASDWMEPCAARNWKAVLEFAPPGRKDGRVLWPSPGADFPLMQKIKRMFDPRGLLNRGRLYGRI